MSMVDCRVGVEVGFADGRPSYAFRPVEKEKAEKEKIPHGVVFCLATNPYGEVLRIRRAKDKEPYPGHNSVPAGHMEAFNGVCESPRETAVRELWEETKLSPRRVAPYLEGERICDPNGGHVGFAYLMPVGCCTLPVFNEEIEPMESRFEPLDVIAEKMKTEKWTPPSRFIVERLLEDYPDGLGEVL